MSPSFRRAALRVWLGLLGVLLPVLAPAAARAEDRIGISPVIVERVMKPNESFDTSITVSNLGDGDVAVHPSVADFYYDARGQMQFAEEDQEPPAKSASLKAWVSIDAPDQFVLKKNATMQIPVRISVPANAEPGGHYGVVFMQTVPKEEGLVRVSGRVGMLLLIEVPGAVRKTAELQSFTVGSTTEDGRVEDFKSQDFFESGPVDFAFVMKNTGNAHFIPEGNILVKNSFGRTVANLNLQGDEQTRRVRAFPGIERTFLTRWEPGLAIGRYTAELNTKDGTGKPLPPRTTNFTIFPWKVVLGSLAVLLIAIGLLIALIKRYNAYILEQAHRHKR